MPYRTVKYTGETMRALELRIKEIKERGETVKYFEITVVDL